MVRVGAVHEDVRQRDAEGRGDFFFDRIEQVAIEHDHVAGDDGDLPAARLLDDDCHGPKLAIRTGQFVR